MIERLTSRLVEDWRDAKRWWSVRWAALGAIVLPLLQVLPPTLPLELRALFPASVQAIATGAWCLGYIVLRLIAQR